ncbi:MAG TPA: potassium channel family protein [Thermoanaerobaculia bacterium]|nr:potassium channel family protein [Thermoanaerobaculia bacterium]
MFRQSVWAFETCAGVLLGVAVLFDVFETMVLSRRVSRRVRITTLFYRITWPAWRALARRFPDGNRRENFLTIYGPASLLLLIVCWAFGLLVAFALLHVGLDPTLVSHDGERGFWVAMYMSGTTLFTLGLGDVASHAVPGRVLTVLECGVGLGLVTLVISYLPALSEAFSAREVSISLLDARAGSPPTAGELLRRQHCDPSDESLDRLLREWERWSAELLESHVSFPVLAFYRSQHDNQSWVASMTAVLDVCAFVRAAAPAGESEQARLTFAIARHALMDMCRVFQRKITPLPADRLPLADLRRLRASLEERGDRLASEAEMVQRLQAYRAMYEPAAGALSRMLLMPMPPWLPAGRVHDNWMSTL